MGKCKRVVDRRAFLATAAASAAVPPLLAQSAGKAEEIAGERPRVLRAGAATTKITPALGVSLEGYFMKLGPVAAVHDELLARALVLDDGKQRIAICVCDMTVIPGEIFDRAKQIVHRKTGLPPDRMLMSATHTHAAPRVGLGQGKIDRQFYEMLVEQIAAAVIQATGRLAPAKIGWGSRQKPEYCFNRRWWMKPNTIPPNPFGRTTDRVQFNPPRSGDNLVRPAGPVDPEVSVVSVQHADGRPLAVLANYSIHYVGGYARGHVSADYFGVFARRLGELLAPGDRQPQFVGIMSNGTSGNIGGGIDFRGPRKRYPPWTRMEEVGGALADDVAGTVRNIEHHDWVSLSMCERDIGLGIRRPDSERLEWVDTVLTGGKGQPAHRWTPIYANEALLLSKYPETMPVKLQALRIGDLTIGAIPCEVFAETGLALKQASPTADTFIIELANQYHGYLPTPEQHALGAYETWDARSSCLERFADPKIRTAMLELFDQVAMSR
jgi:hypothetical protein